MTASSHLASSIEHVSLIDQVSFGIDATNAQRQMKNDKVTVKVQGSMINGQKGAF